MGHVVVPAWRESGLGAYGGAPVACRDRRPTGRRSSSEVGMLLPLKVRLLVRLIVRLVPVVDRAP